MKNYNIIVSKKAQERIRRNRKRTFNTWKNVNFAKFYIEDHERVQDK